MTLDLTALIKAVKPLPLELVVYVPEGDYVVAPLSHINPPAIVRIVAQGAVRFSGLAVNSCSNLSFEGFVFAPDPSATPTDATDTVKVQSSTNITFRGGRISAVKACSVGIPADSDPGKVKRPNNWVLGQPAGRCINLLNSDHITLDGTEICDGYKGLVLANVSDITLNRVDIHHIRTALVAGGGVNRIVSTDCHLHDAIPWRGSALRLSDGDHCDYWHLWISDSQTAPADGIKLIRLVIDQGASSPEIGVALEDRSPGDLGYTNTDIIDCTFNLNNNQAASTTNHKSGTISGNKLNPVAPLDNPAHAPGFILRNMGPDVKVFGNTSKKTSYIEPFAAQNTFLTAVQIAQMGKV